MLRFFIFLGIIYSNFLISQTLFQSYDPSKFEDRGIKIINFDSSLYILGFSSCQNQLNCSSFVKTDLKGKLIDERIFTDWPYQKNGSDFILDSDTNFVIAGTRAITLTDNAVMTFKVNTVLDSTFSKIYNDPNVQFEYGFRILETKDKNYLIYATKGVQSEWVRQYLIKTDRNGNKLWEKRIDGDTLGIYTNYQYGREIFELDNGDFWMVYDIKPYVISFPNNEFAGIIRTDSLGNKKVNIVFDEYQDQSGELSMCPYKNNGVLVTWSANDSSTYGMKLTYYDSLGNEVWKKKYLHQYGIGKVQTLMNGNIIIYGDNYVGNVWRYIFCLDSMGNLIWQKTFPYDKTLPFVYYIRNMLEFSDSRLSFTGEIDLPNKKGSDILLLLLDKNGCITPGCGDTIYLLPPVANSDLLALREFAFSFSPNPAKENIQLHFINPLNSYLHEFQLHNIEGQKILSQPLSSGSQDITVDLSNHTIPTGTYILQYLREGQLVQAEKVLIQR